MRFKDFFLYTESALTADGQTVDQFPPEYNPRRPPSIRVMPRPGYAPPQAEPTDDLEAQMRQVMPGGPVRKLPDDFSMSPQKFRKRVNKLGIGEISPMKKKQAAALGFQGDLSRDVLTPHKNMSIPRSQMPQIKDREAFIRWLMQNRVKVTREMVSPKRLAKKNGNLLQAFAQSNIYLAKAYKFIKKNKVYDKMMIITSDGRIFDGNHHYLVSAVINEKEAIPVYMVHMPFEQLKDFTKQFPGVTYEEHWDESFGCYIGELVFESWEKDGAV